MFNKNPEIVFIDNDQALCLAWKIKAEFIDKHIICFNNVQDFEEEMNYISKETPIYIDSDLGNNCLGEYESKRLYEAGFKIIILSTGKNSSTITKPYWIQDIVGKNPPF